MLSMLILLTILVALSVLASPPACGDVLVESARDIPVAYDVDVVVVGGSSGAVAAAAEAAEQGASVFLAAPRPYLGEDVCGTYRLWLEPGERPESALAMAMFEEPPAVAALGKGLPFTYKTDIPSGDAHKDTSPPSKLADGKFTSAYSESVEYRGDVTITADLGEVIRLGRVSVMAFQRNGNIELATVAVATSLDGQTWTEAATIRNPELGAGEYIDSALYLPVPLNAEARYVRVIAKKSDNVERLLLGEIVIESAESAAQATSVSDNPIPPMPMQVKRALDQALLATGVQFLYGSVATDVLRDKDGNLAGIVMANRSGRQAVKARVIIDATPRATVARMAGASFTPYPAGPQTFTRVVVGAAVREDDSVTTRKMPTPVQIERSGSSGRAYREAIEYTVTQPMPDDSFASFAEAAQQTRDLTWEQGQIYASDLLFQVPPDQVRARQPMTSLFSGANALDMDALRPEGVDRLYVLGGCADMPRAAAERFLRPLTYMDAGTRVGQAAAEEAGAAPKPRVVCFGDSITAAHYPTKLGRLLPGVKVVNAGGGGNTSTQGLARLDEDVLAHAPLAVVILFGTNDSVLTEPGQYRTPVDAYEANLREMVRRCKEKGAQPILCTIPPIIAELYHERHPKAYYDPDGGLQAILERYRDAVRRVAKDTDTRLADVHGGLAEDLGTLGPGGVHPNAKGEKVVAALVAKEIGHLLPKSQKPADWAKGLHVAADKPVASALPGDVDEFLTGIGPKGAEADTVRSAERSLPILGEYDVVVVGGGTGGAPAGIGAARQGAKTLVVEYLTGLGGVGTLGMIGKYYHGYRGGFTAEIDAGVAAMDGKEGPIEGGWNLEWKMEWYRSELRKAGAEIWYETLGCGAVVEDGVVKGVVVATPQGRGVVLAKVVIDSTGNSDIAAAAGAACIYTDGSHIAVQGTGMSPRKPGDEYTNTDYTLTDDTNVVDRWRIFVAGKAKYPNAYDLAQVIDTRERRRIVGGFVISPLDIFYKRTFPDTVGFSQSNFDTHGFTVHPFFSLRFPDKNEAYAFTPYRCLLPEGLDGILVTGLGISAHRDAMPILRMQPDIQNQGYGAGVAAAMAVKAGVAPRDVDIKAVQAHLVEKGCLPEQVLTDTDSFPMAPERIAEAVAGLSDGYEDVGIILAHEDLALPLLRDAYAKSETPEVRLRYAHALGMMRDPTGAPDLAQSVASTEWDQGWSMTGMGQFGSSLSPLDSRIMALGITGDRQGLEAIVGKLEDLDADDAFSHYRSVAVALEALRGKQAAQPLAELLSKPGMTGHTYTAIEDAERGAVNTDPNVQREKALRELILARALYRCGDYRGVGERILKEYEQDYRGHLARHAHAVLKEGR
jgi:lysophospholipase L1-like esterase